jgi:ATP-binding cassette subfamily B protein
MQLLGAKRPRLVAPEVVQTSAMDCGPAAPKCLLEGFGIPVSYGRLREACQTDIDGTSIDVLEQVAVRLGLDAEQVMIPLDHLLLAEAEALPAIVVVVQPGGATHFVVAWRRGGPWVQVMDPAVGRRWLRRHQLLQEVYIHSFEAPADGWLAWARSEAFCRPLRRRLGRLKCPDAAGPLIAEASAAPDWRGLATVDAATRMVTALVRGGGLRRGREAAQALHALVQRSLPEAGGEAQTIPGCHWSVRPSRIDAAGQELLVLRGAVLVQVRGYTGAPREGPGREMPPDKGLGPELTAALKEPPSRPARDLLRLVGREGWLPAAALLGGLAVAAAGLVAEVLLLRAGMDLARDLRLVEQRLGAVGFLLVFLAALLLVELRVIQSLFRLGRLLEIRLRMAFLRKIPRLNDRYFQSRPTSDMAERSHATHQVRHLPWLGGQLLQKALTLLLTAGAISLLYPGRAALAWLAVLAAVSLPLAFKPRLEEQDLRVRTQTGALSRFYFDALLGLVPVRAHTAEASVRREHESLLVEWARAGFRLARSVALVEALVAVTGFGLAGWLLFRHLHDSADVAGSLLLAYWALQLPVLGGELGLLVAQYPFYRNTVLRLVEPLGAPEDAGPESTFGTCNAQSSGPPGGGALIDFRAVDVIAAGHRILEDIDLRIEPGTHVAVVGPSGAGKSSLIGVLLGWHRPARGEVLHDRRPLSPARLNAVRRETVWIDPTVQLWNRSLLENLWYGRDGDWDSSPNRALDDADLYDVLDRLPDGLQTRLGESGGLLSAGEGQRVRFGRGLHRTEARLVLLDEPFRGLERGKRRELLRRARRLWRRATLVCVTHDVRETEGFDRVLVMEGGRILEDGSPRRLAEQVGSRYRSLLRAEEEVQDHIRSGAAWRRLWLRDGRISEQEGCRP